MFRLIIDIALVLAISTSVSAGEDSLTLVQAIEQALKQNAGVAASRQRVAIARGHLAAARALSNPELTLTPLGAIEDSQLTLEQRFDFLSGKLAFRSRAASADLRVAQADLRTAEVEIATEVSQAYIELLLALRSQQLTEDAVKLARSLHQTAQKAFDAGDVPRTHVVRTRIELTRTEGELTKAQSEVAVRRAALNTLMALDPAAPIMPADELIYHAADLRPDALKRLASRQRPELLSAQFALQGSQSRVKLARAERLPDLAFQFKQDKLTDSETQKGLGFVLPLFDLGRIRGETRAARAQVGERNALLSQTQQQVAFEVETAVRRAQAAQQLVASYDRRILPDANDLMRMVASGYREGGVTLLDVIDAQRTLTTARLEYAQAVALHEKAIAELERAIGGKLPMAELKQ